MVIKLNFCSDFEHFGQDFEVEIQARLEVGIWSVFCRQPIAVSDISVYICLIDIRDGSCKPVYGGVDRLQALSSAKTGHRSCFFMN